MNSRAHRGRISGLGDDRGQSLVEFAFALPIMLMLFVAVADFGRVFATGIEVENSARDAAEVAANEYLRQPPAPLASPAPTGSASYYQPLHLIAARAACDEMRDLPNTTYNSGDCPTMPAVLVCVHDNQDPSCNVTAFGNTPPPECTALSGLTNAQAAGGSERWVEVRVCYHFTMFQPIPIIPLGDVWLQRTRTFVIPCYFALGSASCG